MIITYYYNFFESFSLERMSFHQLLWTYYRDMGIAVSIKEFHLVNDIKLIIIINYYFELFYSFPLGMMSFHQPLISYWKDIRIAIIFMELHQVEKIKEEVMLASVGGV